MTKKSKNEVSFYEFVDVWNTLVEVEDFEIPVVHADIIKFLEEDYYWKDDSAVLELWRGVGKSTLVGLFIVWKLTIDPRILFLILSDCEKTAKKMVKHCKSIIQRHPLAQKLEPQSKRNKRAHWSSTSFSVVGADQGREASVTALGIDSRGVGSRCNYLIFDDVETDATSNTDDKYEAMMTSVYDATKYLTPDGKTLYIGTPWATKTIYEEKVSDGASQLKIPMLTKLKGEFPNYKGVSRWPERFNEKEIEKVQKQKCKTASDFLSQFQLIPAQDAECVFSPEKLIKYDEEIAVTTFNGKPTYRLLGKQLVGVNAFLDPALNRKKSDDSVFSIVYQTAEGHYFIHRTFKLTGDVHQQCEQVRRYVLEFGLPSVTVEDNGVGANVGTVLRPYLKPIKCAVIEERTSENKMKKIEGTFAIPLNTKAMYVSKHVYDPTVAGSKFITQLRGFTGRAKGKDDYIDCVAMAMNAAPIRLGRGSIAFDGSVNSAWREGNEGFEYKTDDIQW